MATEWYIIMKASYVTFGALAIRLFLFEFVISLSFLMSHHIMCSWCSWHTIASILLFSVLFKFVFLSETRIQFIRWCIYKWLYTCKGIESDYSIGIDVTVFPFYALTCASALNNSHRYFPSYVHQNYIEIPMFIRAQFNYAIDINGFFFGNWAFH